MLDSFTFRNHLCITFEILSMNLYEFLKMGKFWGLKESLVKRFSIQILIGLMFMHKFSIVHCDLKPENILLKRANKSGIKIVDFGSGCFERKWIYTYI